MDRTTHLKVALFLCVLVVTLGPVANAQFGGGTGEPNDPYLICTSEQMNAIGADPNCWNKHFKLMADIDLSAYGEDGFAIIGISYDATFTGVFDGNGHTISNFTFKADSGRNIGLFGVVRGTDAVIMNVGMIDPCIELDEPGELPNSSCIGSLVGCLSDATVYGCYAHGGTVDGTNREKNGPDGGMLSKRQGVSSNFAGGLVGNNAVGSVVCSYSTVSVSVFGKYMAGGLVGMTTGTVENCYAAGPVTGDAYSTNGLIGCSRWSKTVASFWDMEASGQVAGDAGMGLTTMEMQDPNNFIAVGWDFAGPRDGIADMWMVDPNTGYPMLWWEVPESERPEPLGFSGGDGTQEDPYLVSTAQELANIGSSLELMSGHFKLVADINMAGTEFWPIGGERYPFTGVFDGDGWTISNVTFTTKDRNEVGFFGYIEGQQAQVRSLTLAEPNIVADNGSCVGGLVGHLRSGTITQCRVLGGTITGNEYVGGLIGRNQGRAVTCCSTISIVMGWGAVGGLTGSHGGGVLANCYSRSLVTGDSYVAGLVGSSDVMFSNNLSFCYAAGPVYGRFPVCGLIGGSRTGVEHSFWDIEASQQTCCCNGTGLATAEMMDINTYLEAGWDFVGETDNGTEDIWWIDDGLDYPRLWWEEQE